MLQKGLLNKICKINFYKRKWPPPFIILIKTDIFLASLKNVFFLGRGGYVAELCNWCSYGKQGKLDQFFWQKTFSICMRKTKINLKGDRAWNTQKNKSFSQAPLLFSQVGLIWNGASNFGTKWFVPKWCSQNNFAWYSAAWHRFSFLQEISS